MCDGRACRPPERCALLNAAPGCYPAFSLPVFRGWGACTAPTVHAAKRQCEGSPPETGLCGWALSAFAVVRRAHLCRTRMLSCALCSSSYPTPLVCPTLSKVVGSQPCARAVRAPPQPRAHAEPAHRAGSRRADAYCLPNCARHLDSVRRAPKQMAPFMWLRPQPWQTCASGH